MLDGSSVDDDGDYRNILITSVEWCASQLGRESCWFHLSGGTWSANISSGAVKWYHSYCFVLSDTHDIGNYGHDYMRVVFMFIQSAPNSWMGYYITY